LATSIVLSPAYSGIEVAKPALDKLELIPFVLTSEGDRIEPKLIELRESVVEER
jgi:hypothetical protein